MNNSSIKKSPFSFAMTLLSALFLAGVIIFSILYMRHFLWVNVLICAFPLVFFGLIFALCIFDKIGKKTCIIVNVVLIFVLGVTMFFNGIWMLFADSVEHTTNVREYSKVLRIYNYPHSSSMKHFPSEIPFHAENISFWENPQFLQGGSRVLLMYKTTQTEIAAYRKEYSEQAQIILPAGKKEKLTDKYVIPSIDVMNNKELVDDFEVIILGGTPFANHGYTYGLATNDITNEILFFSERW